MSSSKRKRSRNSTVDPLPSPIATGMKAVEDGMEDEDVTETETESNDLSNSAGDEDKDEDRKEESHPKQSVQPGGQWQWQWVPQRSGPILRSGPVGTIGHPPSALPGSIGSPSCGPILRSGPVGPIGPPPSALPGLIGSPSSGSAGPSSQGRARSKRRRTQKDLENISKMRSMSGLKPNQVHVSQNGELVASSHGKNAWDQSLRAYAPLCIDMSVIEWRKHKPETLKRLRDCMDAEFEYIGNSLSNMGFRNAVMRYLKCERCKLKKLSVAESEGDCPVYIDLEQWKRLKVYWSQSEQVVKSEVMSNIRKQVHNISRHGRKGKARMTNTEERSPCLSEVSSLKGSFIARLEAKMDTLESKEDEFQKFKVDVLATTERNTKALETLQESLMSFLQKDNSKPEVIAQAEPEVIAEAEVVAQAEVEVIAELQAEVEVIAEPEAETEVRVQEEVIPEVEVTVQPEVIGDPYDLNPDVGVEGDVIMLDGCTPKPPESSKSPRKTRKTSRNEQEKAFVVKEILVRKEGLRKKVEPQPSSQPFRKPSSKRRPKVAFPKYSIGQHVSLLNPEDPEHLVAAGYISGIGGQASHHGKPIPKGWYRVDVAHAPGGFVALMSKNPAGDQFKLKDVVGANTIWDGRLLVVFEAQGEAVKL